MIMAQFSELPISGRFYGQFGGWRLELRVRNTIRVLVRVGIGLELWLWAMAQFSE